MGLLEKRAIKAYEEEVFANYANEINGIADYKIEIEVKWDTLAVPDSTHLYNEGFRKVYFLPIIKSLTEIAQDDLGKEALKSTLKKIIIKNEEGIYSASNAYNFSNGILVVDHEPFTNMDNITERSEVLTKLLISKM